MKTKDVIFLSDLFGQPDVRLTKIVNDDNKFAIILLLPKLKEVAEKYRELVKEAQEKLHDEAWDGYAEKLRVWQRDGDDALTEEERKVISEYFKKAQECINKFAERELDKDVDIDIAPIRDCVRQIVLSNDFLVADVQRLMEIVK